MNRAAIALRLAAAAAIVLAVGLAAGCGRNHAGTLLAPTGIRPAPLVNTGSVTGAVLYDPLNTPDLAAGPFPPTRVELWSGATLVAVDSLGPFSQMYLFEHVKPGPYAVVIQSLTFRTGSRAGLNVRQEPIDAGNVTLSVDPLAMSSSIDVIGDIPGYTFDQLGMGTTTLLQNTLGIWTLSATDFLFMPPPTIPAGTYRFKFVNSYASTAGNLIGWGGSSTETLTAPVTSHASILASGPATDLVVHFPTTDVYAFTFDERRQRFSIQVSPAPASPFARR